MDLNGNQFSIDHPYSDNTACCYKLPLPRSFKHSSHVKRAYGPFLGLLIDHLGPNSPSYEKRCYGFFWGLSSDFLHRFTNPLLGLSCVWVNSRARVLSITQGNQTRLCRTCWFPHEVSLGRAEVLARLAEDVCLQSGSKKNFLFVSQCRAKFMWLRPDFREVTPYLII